MFDKIWFFYNFNNTNINIVGISNYIIKTLNNMNNNFYNNISISGSLYSFINTLNLYNDHNNKIISTLLSQINNIIHLIFLLWSINKHSYNTKINNHNTTTLS